MVKSIGIYPLPGCFIIITLSLQKDEYNIKILHVEYNAKN